MSTTTTTRFDAALGIIGASANGEGHGRSDHQARDATPEPAGNVDDAASHGVLLRTADVRTVRREDRLNAATGKTRSVVVVDFVASTEDIDSHESILTCDWAEDGRLARYQSNPVVLWMHDRTFATPRPAIGLAENVRVDGKRLLLTVVCDDTSEFDREIAEKLAKGVLRAGSVGFAPGECECIEVGNRTIIRFYKNELREFSVCNVGSNQYALAQAQRALVTAAREMARSHGGHVAMRDVVAQYRAQQDAARAAIQPPTAPPAPATPTTAPARAAGDTTMTTPNKKKTMDLEARSLRVDDAGLTAEAACPHCEAPIEVSARALPVAPKVAADLGALEKRAVDAEAKLIRETAEREAVEKRAAALDAKLATAETTIAQQRRAAVDAAIDARVGTKIEPTERDDQIRLALLDLADVTPDPDKAGSTLGDKAFAARLAKLDARRDIGLVGGPITGGAKDNTGAGKDPEARSLAAEIDAIVAKQPLTLHN